MLNFHIMNILIYKLKNVSIVTTSYDNETENLGVMITYKLLTTTKNVSLVNSWHSHPGKYDVSTGWPAYPSGFDYKGNIISDEGANDRGGYNWNKQYYPNRTPMYNYIYIPSAKKVVKYNGKAYKVN